MNIVYTITPVNSTMIDAPNTVYSTTVPDTSGCSAGKKYAPTATDPPSNTAAVTPIANFCGSYCMAPAATPDNAIADNSASIATLNTPTPANDALMTPATSGPTTSDNASDSRSLCIKPYVPSVKNGVAADTSNRYGMSERENPLPTLFVASKMSSFVTSVSFIRVYIAQLY